MEPVSRQSNLGDITSTIATPGKAGNPSELSHNIETVEMNPLQSTRTPQNPVSSPQFSIQQTPPNHYAAVNLSPNPQRLALDHTPESSRADEHFATAPSTPLPLLSSTSLEPSRAPAGSSVSDEKSDGNSDASRGQSADISSSGPAALHEGAEDPSDLISPVPSRAALRAENPGFQFTLLLLNGLRHKMVVGTEQLRKQNVEVAGGNPMNMSVYTLKELIWRQWKDGKRWTLSFLGRLPLLI